VETHKPNSPLAVGAMADTFESPAQYLRLLRRHHPQIARGREPGSSRSSGYGASPASTARSCSTPAASGGKRAMAMARQNEQPADTLNAKDAVGGEASEFISDAAPSKGSMLLSPASPAGTGLLELGTATQQCPHCTRRFNKEAAARHIPICASLKNRPKPPAKEAGGAFTDSLGRRRPRTGERSPGDGKTTGGDSANSLMHVNTPSRSCRPASASYVPPTNSGARSGSTPAPQEQDPARGALSALSQQWCLVQFLLKDGLEAMYSDAAIEQTSVRSEEGLRFLDRLESCAQRLRIRKGALSRMLLPFDNETSSNDQASSAIALGSQELEGLLSNEERGELVAKAVSLRRLIRVKVADCADVEQAREGLKLTVSFLQALKRMASEEQRSMASVLRDL